jgi:hypothetical protein
MRHGQRKAVKNNYFEEIKKIVMSNEDFIYEVITCEFAPSFARYVENLFKKGSEYTLNMWVEYATDEEILKLVKWGVQSKTKCEYYTYHNGEIIDCLPSEFIKLRDINDFDDLLKIYITELGFSDDKLNDLCKKYFDCMGEDLLTVDYTYDGDCSFMLPQYAPVKVIDKMIEALERHKEYLLAREEE